MEWQEVITICDKLLVFFSKIKNLGKAIENKILFPAEFPPKKFSLYFTQKF
jgi:hypothetical protein